MNTPTTSAPVAVRDVEPTNAIISFRARNMISSTRRRSQVKPTSSRWATTMQAAQDETERALADELAETRAKGQEPVDRKAQLRAMKVALQRTSISFGKEKIDYISDTMEKQQQCLVGFSVEERTAQTKRIKDMKAELTQTNFCLGDEIPVYESVNTEAMRFTEKAALLGKVEMNTGLKEAIKKSSIHFGNESGTFKSVAHEGMEYILKGNTNDFSKLKRETKELTSNLRKHNFTFGDEKNEYKSDSHRGYQNYGAEHYRQIGEGKAKAKVIIADTRSAHFTFGSEKIDYISDTHRAMRTIEGTATPEGAAIEKAQKERSRDMKIALTTTSINLGDDEQYL